MRIPAAGSSLPHHCTQELSPNSGKIERGEFIAQGLCREPGAENCNPVQWAPAGPCVGACSQPVAAGGKHRMRMHTRRSRVLMDSLECLLSGWTEL